MPESPDLAEFEALDENEELRRINGDLQRRLKRAKAKTEDLVAATFDGARDALLSLGALPPVPAPAKDRRKTKTAEVALWHLTDWQGTKVTPTYNSQVMVERVMNFAKKAVRLTEIQRKDHPVRKCVILFGGDMGEGLFNYPTQPFEIDATIFGQFTSVAHLEAECVRYALANYDEVEVVSEFGNHGRIGSKRAAVPRADNFDRMTYELAREKLRGEQRLTWEDSTEDLRRVEIGNYRALLIHGDEFGRNGFVSPSTMVTKVSQWQSGVLDFEFRDCYTGHKHTHNEWPLPNGLGSVYQSGSPESDSRYARDGLAVGSVPSQRLHFIDPVKGRVTAIYKVWL